MVNGNSSGGCRGGRDHGRDLANSCNVQMPVNFQGSTQGSGARISDRDAGRQTEKQMQPFEVIDFSGKGFMAANPQYVQGLALIHDQQRGYAVVKVWVQFDVMVSEEDAWVPIAEVDDSMLLQFLRRYWTLLELIVHLIAQETAQPYRKPITDSWSKPVIIIPHPGHPSYWPAPWAKVKAPASQLEQFVIDAPRTHKQAFRDLQAYLDDQKPLALPNLAALQLDTMEDSGPGTPSLPFIVSDDEDSDYTPSVDSEEEEVNSVLVDISELMDLDFTLAWDLRK